MLNSCACAREPRGVYTFLEKNCIFRNMETIAAFILSTFGGLFLFLSAGLGLMAPLFSFIAYRDLKDGRKLPWIVHLAGFFGMFTFVSVVCALLGDIKPDEMSVYIFAPSLAGVFMLWLAGLYLLITRK